MKNIIFDIGSVIVKGHACSILNKLNLNEYEYNELLRFFKDLDDLDLGYELLSNEFDRFEFSNDIYKYKDVIIKYYELRELNNDLLRLIDNLKNKYNIYILTDNNIEATNYYKNKFNFYKGFISSSDYHAIKKTGELFKIIIDKYNLNPNECYFIDDKIENIKAGQKFGIKGFLFDENKDINLLYNDMINNGINI